MTIKSLTSVGVSKSVTARLLGVSEGAVRFHLERTAKDASDGRALQPSKAAAFATAIAHWRNVHGAKPVNLAARMAGDRARR